MENEKDGKIEIPIETHLGFGPMILKMIITEDAIEDFNIAFDQINDFGKQDDFKFAGFSEDFVDQRLKMPFDILKGYVDFFRQSISAYLSMSKNAGAEGPDNWTVTFDDACISNCTSGSFIKSRSGNYDQLSCISFLSMDDNGFPFNCEITVSVPGPFSMFRKNTFKIQPKPGDMYIFPSYFQISMSPIQADRGFSLRMFEGWMTISAKPEEVWPMLHGADHPDTEEDQE